MVSLKFGFPAAIRFMELNRYGEVVTMWTLTVGFRNEAPSSVNYNDFTVASASAEIGVARMTAQSMPPVDQQDEYPVAPELEVCMVGNWIDAGIFERPLWALKIRFQFPERCKLP